MEKQVQEILENLNPIEKKVLPFIELKTLDAIHEKSGIEKGNINKAIQLFASKKLIDLTVEEKKLIQLDIKSGSIISLGTGKEIKIKDLACRIMKIFNKKVEIKFLDRRKEPMRSVADLKMLTSLGIDPKKFTKIENGIEKLI